MYQDDIQYIDFCDKRRRKQKKKLRRC